MRGVWKEHRKNAVLQSLEKVHMVFVKVIFIFHIRRVKKCFLLTSELFTQKEVCGRKSLISKWTVFLAHMFRFHHPFMRNVWPFFIIMHKRLTLHLLIVNTTAKKYANRPKGIRWNCADNKLLILLRDAPCFH